MMIHFEYTFITFPTMMTPRRLVCYRSQRHQYNQTREGVCETHHDTNDRI